MDTDVRQILAATDFSDTAEAAVRVAIHYAGRLGARLHVLHVPWSGEVDVAGMLARYRDEAGAVPVVTASAVGDPADEIVRYAAEHGIELIVVGTHGRTGVTRALLGSVAERVARTAPCPVLTVPPAARAPLAAPGQASVPAVAAQSLCVVCGTSSGDLICEPCRARIRGELLLRKHHEERAARA